MYSYIAEIETESKKIYPDTRIFYWLAITRHSTLISPPTSGFFQATPISELENNNNNKELVEIVLKI